MLIFWKRVYLPFIILIASPSVYRMCSFCTYSPWSDWTCKCNHPNQTRERSICCPPGVMSAEECASFCNITLNFWEEEPCTICKNGGVFDQHSGKCNCTPTYSGAICCGKLEYQCFTVILMEGHNFMLSSRNKLLGITKSTLQILRVVRVLLCDF